MSAGGHRPVRGGDSEAQPGGPTRMEGELEVLDSPHRTIGASSIWVSQRECVLQALQELMQPLSKAATMLPPAAIRADPGVALTAIARFLPSLAQVNHLPCITHKMLVEWCTCSCMS